MLTQKITHSFTLPNGQEVTLGTGTLARQADGAITIQVGDLVMLATVVAKKEPKEGQDFFPLSVDYQEKMGSAGRIPGSFFKREGRLNDSEILISRLVDRALRPLFPEYYVCDVQVLITLISSDKEIMPDAMACLAASCALAVSDIPVNEAISEVRVARINGEFKVNPLRSELATADMDFIIAATNKNIMMVEGESKECSEDDLIKAIEIGHEAIRVQIEAQNQLRAKVGITTKREVPEPVVDQELLAKVKAFVEPKIAEIARSFSDKHTRSDNFKAVGEALQLHLAEGLAEGETVDSTVAKNAKTMFHDFQYYGVRDMMLNESVRLDGRKLTEIRQLTMSNDVLPSPHGSALFTRGETQSLTTVTLGTKLDELLIESAAESNYSKFYLHYNFPPFSTGEVKPMRGVGRREVGHGNLALRSLKQMMPAETAFPYTVRVVSDVLESNGSSSMATVCAGSLALMDAGVPLKKHVSGIAMGLISKGDQAAILSDILGDEDHLGDMDFKVTGTKDGICGVQMDIKIDGLSMELLGKALNQAKAGRLHILDAMHSTIAEARSEVKPHAPRMEFFAIDSEYIGAVIGPGGKIIQEIQRETGTTITLEEKDRKGNISIFGTDKAGVQKAVNWIKGIVAVPDIGEVYDAKVMSIMPYGAFVEFLPGKQGLLHISEIRHERLDTLDGIIKEGEIVKVKLLDIDQKSGKYKLSAKVLIPRP
jgi:polyribonucleotide nucleotidyltransferase